VTSLRTSAAALEQLEGLALVFLLRVLLRIAAQVDALAQVVERRQVLAPVGVEALQHARCARTVNQAAAIDSGGLFGVGGIGGIQQALEDVVVAELRLGLDPLADRQLELPARPPARSRPDVPLLLDAFGRNIEAEGVVDLPLAHGGDGLGDVLALEQFVALLVDHLALVVGDVVVFEQLLADVEVALLDLALRDSRASG
jgi:hypothetical protein